MQDDDKRLAAEAAIAEVCDGMIVGLGTGSTAAHAIRALGKRVRDHGLKISGVATSNASDVMARQYGIRQHDLMRNSRIDLAIDGVDEIDPRLFAIKGAGGAMLREKIIATAADRMVAIADGSKRVGRIGAAKLPVEFLPSASAFIERELRGLGAEPVRRAAETGAEYRTDQGNWIFDCTFAAMNDPAELSRALSAVPGMFGHGIFLSEIDAAYIAQDGVVTKMERPGLLMGGKRGSGTI
jgi:ribose 5-phosphate isomerase A